ncbi:MAG: sulfatase-like hydrolase/transferase, partial [Opitutales bacterium]|nr:sulfatase-like hydrolase/transferase [Opitutales bacterium]
MYIRYTLLRLSAGLFALALSISITATNKPNVVIFLTDDQGTLDVTRFGANDLQTPYMDSLADNGVSFTQAYAHTVCCPSRAALLTGRHPNRGGVQSWLQGDRNGSDTHLGNMNPSEITLAEVLKEAGYRTALFGKWHLGAKIGHGPLDQGFEKHFGHLSGFIDNFTHYFLHGQGYHDLYDNNEEIFRRGEYFPDMIVNEAVKYVDKHSDEPFFMMVAFNLPHYPEQPSEEFKEAFADLEMPRQSYARVMATVDKQIGRVLKQLDESGIQDETIIIFSSDNGHSEENNRGITVGYHNSGYPIGHYYLAHGGGGYTGKWIGRKGTFLEGGGRVPMIISY